MVLKELFNKVFSKEPVFTYKKRYTPKGKIIYTCTVFVYDCALANGTGNKKKVAKENSAEHALAHHFPKLKREPKPTGRATMTHDVDPFLKNELIKNFTLHANDPRLRKMDITFKSPAQIVLEYFRNMFKQEITFNVYNDERSTEQNHRVYLVDLEIASCVLFTGTGSTKKDAKQLASKLALRALCLPLYKEYKRQAAE